MNKEIKEILSLLNSSSWSNEAKTLEDHITILEKGIEYAKRIEKDYKTRFDKAIEYIQNRIEDINNGGNEHDYRNLNEILNILQGSDINE